MPKIDKGTQIRIVLFILTWLNTFAANNGWIHIPFPYVNDETAAIVLTFIISSWSKWKNNYITIRGRAQRSVLQREGLAKRDTNL
jgi:SPP1 family holin